MIHSVCPPKFRVKNFVAKWFQEDRVSQEHLKTTTYAKFGEQADKRIMGNSKKSQLGPGGLKCIAL